MNDVDERAGAAAAVTRLTRWVDDFPVAGVRFGDLTPVFADGPALRSVVSELAQGFEDVDLVAGIDARGFLLGAGVALELGCGVLAVRKAGKLPPPVHSRSYELEYGTAALQIPTAIDVAGKRVLVVDDVLATGGTVDATARLLTEQGAVIVGAAVVLEIAVLGGRDKCSGYPLGCLVRV
ncbi:adenine phosphoribosyltransferase [Rhodococcus sp. 15-725-2-2b]|jgi:adenine phosphoribosyltransferase|nr:MULTISPECIES: adenine phosphoribosyltransferase [unclassified Rhodococcus (in: high G+C Gram-positive bacteria)]OZC60944.1 adenine phosphoribosyltransferase [Rhodococcus sp. 06-470-2]OZC71649.1 adenine phosphoribosyltransferase [Rhodococcus sp. 06-469-3-2]OZC82941.1 adenine phosphoribosyltransferase [Rhodococcus sp. 06-418-5]OZD42438.1 adenine phosphoribosyltransferase [Rhodococcus sp. 06-1477-1A]OZE05908.1 adenine phosphoribosyltransferase [Rhodococcus sp. 05-2255-3B1]